MKNYTVRKYLPEDYKNWNAFISEAKNATFLFHRDFMEYHSDRFKDFSLVVLDGDNWIAVIPANVVGNEVFSHQGLTYGGLVYDKRMKLPVVLSIFKNVLEFLHANEIQRFSVKMMPSIYYDFPSDELNYALFLVDAKLVRRDSLSILDLSKPSLISKDRFRCIKRGSKNGLVVKEEAEFKLFWGEILIPNLNKKHHAKPVHSVTEIEKLYKLFPKNIRHFNVYHNGKIVGGTTMFISENVAHPQYISANNIKNKLGSIDFLYYYLITVAFKDKRFFDFGPSNEQSGKNLKEGIVFWKESFGARTLTQDFYEVETSNFSKLETVLI